MFALTGALVLTGAVPATGSTYRAHNAASLQAAVASADASVTPSTIELTAGVFLPTSTLDISGDVTIVGVVQDIIHSVAWIAEVVGGLPD